MIKPGTLITFLKEDYGFNSNDHMIRVVPVTNKVFMYVRTKTRLHEEANKNRFEKINMYQHYFLDPDGSKMYFYSYLPLELWLKEENRIQIL